MWVENAAGVPDNMVFQMKLFAMLKVKYPVLVSLYLLLLYKYVLVKTSFKHNLERPQQRFLQS